MSFFKYEIEIICENCNYPNKTKVPKGTSIKDFIKDIECTCENCKVTFTPIIYKTRWK